MYYSITINSKQRNSIPELECIHLRHTCLIKPFLARTYLILARTYLYRPAPTPDTVLSG
jgi:hypothetical protein